MTKSVANVSISTDTFAGWVGKTNILLDALTNEIVTVNASTSGSNSAGNGSVIGIFAANVVSTPVIRGGASGNTGNVQTLSVGFSNATVSSNVVITGYAANVTANTLTISSNTSITGANLNISSTNTAIVGDKLNVSSNVHITGANTTIDNTVTLSTLRVTANTFVNTHILFNSNNSVLQQIVSNVTYPGDGTTSNNITSFPYADYKSGKLSITIKDKTTTNANNIMFSEMSFVFYNDGSANTVYFTEYGIIYNNTRFVSMNVSSNATNIILTGVSNSTVTNTDVTITATLHK